MEGKKRDKDTMAAYTAIMASDLPEVEKVHEAFKLVTDFYITDGEREMELLRAMSDRENLVKVQIKVSTFRSAQAILSEAFRMASRQTAAGRKV
ncbi:MAG: hypothetical protein IAE79_04940 [Anaerolinea sp.]|nr:hypothetical protein [Anaerolinea sp.]